MKQGRIFWFKEQQLTPVNIIPNSRIALEFQKIDKFLKGHGCRDIVLILVNVIFLQYSKSRGVIPVSSCLTVKGAEDVLNKQFAFELSTNRDTMYFIADTDKVSPLF